MRLSAISLKLAGIVGATLIGAIVLAALALVSFFYYMSLGELISSPRGGNVTVAFSDEPDVTRVFGEICHVFPSEERTPTERRVEYDSLLAAGRLVQVPDGTPITVNVLGGPVTHFRFRSGRWKGREGRACSGAVILHHAYP